MTEKLKKLIVDLATGKEEYVDLTPAEIKEHEAMAKANAEFQAQREADAKILEGLKASAKAKLIAGEPLTEAEAEALVV